MKALITFCLIALAVQTQAQKYFTKTGETEFKASVETFEPVEATSKSTTVILNTETSEVAVQIFITSFHFKVALMEEHFNENYMDTQNHPKATFKGKIEGFDAAKLTNAFVDYVVKGTINIKGKDKVISTTIKIKKDGEKIMVKGSLDLSPADFGIEIPSAVSSKISKQIKVNMNYGLAKKK